MASTWLDGGSQRKASGERDKIYIDPVSGYKFRSKLEVLRYLGIMEPKNPKKRDGSNLLSNAIRIVQDGSLDESLNLEFRETNNNRIDRYYIHPVSGLKFRSKNEVYRYIQNGEMPRDRNKRRVDDAELTGRKFLLSSVAKIRKRDRSCTKRRLLTGQSSNISEVENNKRVLKLSDVYASVQGWKGMQCYNASKRGLLLSNTGDSKNRHTDRACAEKEYIEALSEVTPQKRQAQNSVGKSRNKKPQPNPQKIENERDCRLALRTSRRLAGFEPELPPEMGLNHRRGKHIVLAEPTTEVDTEKDMHPLGEQPNELGKTYEKGDAPTDFTMKLASEEPESKVTLPMAEGDTEKDTPSLGGEELPNELRKTSDDKDAPADYPMKLSSKVSETETTMPSVEVDSEKKMHSLGVEGKPNEIRKTSEDKDAPGDNPMKLASKEPKSEIAMLRVEVDDEKDMHSLGTEEQLNEPGITSQHKDAPEDYGTNFAFNGPQSGLTLPVYEPSLDPCLVFAYKTLTGIIPIENLPIKRFSP